MLKLYFAQWIMIQPLEKVSSRIQAFNFRILIFILFLDCYRKMLTIDDQVCICELIDIYNGESYNNYSYKETILKQGQGFIVSLFFIFKK